MPQGNPKPGERYLHFKNKIYQVIAIGRHSETSDRMVVYQALYGNFEVYIRSYDSFVGDVDHEKYPEISQKYRFKLIPEEENISEISKKEDDDYLFEMGDYRHSPKKKKESSDFGISDEMLLQAMMKSPVEEKTKAKPAPKKESTEDLSAELLMALMGNVSSSAKQTEAKNDNAALLAAMQTNATFSNSHPDLSEKEQHPLVTRFLSTSDLEEQFQLLLQMKEIIDHDMVDIMMDYLGVDIPDDYSIEERYLELKMCVRARQAFGKNASNLST